MIGTFDNVLSNEVGTKLFEERLIKALIEHFDTDIIVIEAIPDLFDGNPEHQMGVFVDASHYDLRIIETWIV